MCCQSLLSYICENYDELYTKFKARITGPTDHWAITFLDHLEMIRDFPYSLPNTYNLYYLYPDRTYGHYSLEHTRYDEVVAGASARSSGGAARSPSSAT